MLNDLGEVSFAIHQNSRDKGFWDLNVEPFHTLFYLSRIALIDSESAEVLEAIRKEKGDDVVVEELADIIIRTLDLWAGLVHDGYTKRDIGEAIRTKMAKNAGRPQMHGVLA